MEVSPIPAAHGVLELPSSVMIIKREPLSVLSRTEAS
jgi:hypothetical protein